MQGAVFFLVGSYKTLSSLISGICSFMSGRNSSQVTMKMFSFGHMDAMRRYVCCMSVCPVPVRSRNCLGFSVVLSGQNRPPSPPAIIMQKWFLFMSVIIFIAFGCQ